MIRKTVALNSAGMLKIRENVELFKMFGDVGGLLVCLQEMDDMLDANTPLAEQATPRFVAEYKGLIRTISEARAEDEDDGLYVEDTYTTQAAPEPDADETLEQAYERHIDIMDGLMDAATKIVDELERDLLNPDQQEAGEKLLKALDVDIARESGVIELIHNELVENAYPCEDCGSCDMCECEDDDDDDDDEWDDDGWGDDTVDSDEKKALLNDAGDAFIAELLSNTTPEVDSHLLEGKEAINVAGDDEWMRLPDAFKCSGCGGGDATIEQPYGKSKHTLVCPHCDRRRGIEFGGPKGSSTTHFRFVESAGVEY